jgi:hypothetical protein
MATFWSRRTVGWSMGRAMATRISLVAAALMAPSESTPAAIVSTTGGA